MKNELETKSRKRSKNNRQKVEFENSIELQEDNEKNDEISNKKNSNYFRNTTEKSGKKRNIFRLNNLQTNRVQNIGINNSHQETHILIKPSEVSSFNNNQSIKTLKNSETRRLGKFSERISNLDNSNKEFSEIIDENNISTISTFIQMLEIGIPE